jgi:antibiotic biosynthesis monooxygenase (ABM) superfamily enzyme
MFPFGVQIKGFIVGLLMAYLVIPWVQRFIASRSSAAPAQ